eukprot:2937560-Amphidinium_carterae.1
MLTSLRLKECNGPSQALCVVLRRKIGQPTQSVDARAVSSARDMLQYAVPSVRTNGLDGKPLSKRDSTESGKGAVWVAATLVVDDG